MPPENPYAPVGLPSDQVMDPAATGQDSKSEIAALTLLDRALRDGSISEKELAAAQAGDCLLYTSDAADDS